MLIFKRELSRDFDYKTKIKMMRFSIFLCLLTVLLACTDESSFFSPPTGPMGFMSDDEFFPNVQPELRPFFLAFEEEATERGISINLTELGITGNIVNLGGGGVIGLCRRNDNEPNRIAVDPVAWQNGTDAFRELVVFHELGHCVLDREHRDEQENGVCLSIMHSGLTDCTVSLEDTVIREEYIDELFFF